MIVLDTIFAGLIVKFFGEQGMFVLAVMVGVAILRTCYKADRHFNIVEQMILYFGEEEKEEI